MIENSNVHSTKLKILKIFTQKKSYDENIYKILQYKY